MPNLLVIHLQRITFDYNTFQMKKINDEISFYKELNIKKYTTDFDKEDIDIKNYDYELMGLIAHGGTAQLGHYIAFICSQDKNNENILFKFNDSIVTQTTYENMLSDIVSESYHEQYNPSAYMLLYIKKVKNPILMNAISIKNHDNIINSLKEENNEIIMDNEFKYEVYLDENDAKENNKNIEKLNKKVILKNNKLIVDLMSYEEGLNCLNKIKENYNEENIPFKSLIIEENIKFNNDKKIYSYAFGRFINDIANQIKSGIESCNNFTENYESIIQILNYYIFNIFIFSEHKENLKEIINNICFLGKDMPIFISKFIKEFIEPKKIIYIEYLLNKDKILVEVLSNYFGIILSISINKNIENETSMKIINYYLDKIPVELSKDLNRMGSFNNFIATLVENSDIIKEIFLSNNIIPKIIYFILGKESPLYINKKDDKFDNSQIKGNLSNLAKCIHLLYKYYLDKKDTNDMIILSKEDLDMLDYIPFYEKFALNENDDNNSILELISIKLNTFNNKDPSDNSYFNFFLKVIIPVSNNIKSLELCLNLMEKSINNLNNKDNDQKDQLLHILQMVLGIPSFKEKRGEIDKICYISTLNFDYYGLINNIVKMVFNSNLINFCITYLYKYMLKYDYLYEYLSSIPAPNSTEYSFIEFLIKKYHKSNDGTVILILDQKPISQEERDDWKNTCEELYKKYNINKDSIINNNQIKTTNNLHIMHSKDTLVQDLKNKNIEDICLEKFKTNENEIKFYYYKSHCITERKEPIDEIYYKRRRMPMEDYFMNEKNKFFIEGVFLKTSKDLNLEISFEPYIYSFITISAKKNKKYYLFVKKWEKPKKENQKDDYENNINFSKLNFKITESEKNGEKTNGNEGNAVLSNENAFIINCPFCESPNTIDENNELLRCNVCGSELL